METDWKISVTKPPRLKAVPKVPVTPPPPDMSYEWRDRQRVAAKDWSRVHIDGDRASRIVNLPFFDLLRRRRGQ